MSIYRPVTPEFFQDASYIEGAVWGGILALEGAFFTSAAKEREKVVQLWHDGDHKSRQLWESNKALFASGSAFFSTLATGFNWLLRAQIVTVSFTVGAVISAVAYSGRALSCGVRLSDKVKTLLQKGSKEKIIPRISLMVKVAAYACIVAWGVLGVCAALTGLPALFPVVDYLFYITSLVLLGDLCLSMLKKPLQQAIDARGRG